MRLSKYIPWIGAAVSALEWADGVGKLPALGWNSWNAFGCDIDESSFLDAAQQMVSRGFKVRDGPDVFCVLPAETRG